MTDRNAESRSTAASEPPAPESSNGKQQRKPRSSRPFPAATFEDALLLPRAIQEHGAGRQIRRLTLFDAMKRKPDSGASRQLVTNSGKYGLTTGSYASEYLDLTELGRQASDPEASEADLIKARFRLAIEHIDIFSKLYENFKNSKLPAVSVLRDSVREYGIPEEFADECVETFMVNCKYVGVLKNLAGAERFLSIEHVLDELPEESKDSAGIRDGNVVVNKQASVAEMSAVVVTTLASFDDACFYVSPIGHDGSEQRRHADLFMGTFIEPVVAEFGMKLIRADGISEAGLITSQIIEHLVRCKLVIADLSFHNPNVFYEVALRHAARKPIVQLIRKSDPIPFDIQPFRTIVIDTTDIYTLVPQIDVYRAEISAQVRKAVEEPDTAENPLSAFYPGFWSQL
jgi:hypothetical protein